VPILGAMFEEAYYRYPGFDTYTYRLPRHQYVDQRPGSAEIYRRRFSDWVNVRVRVEIMGSPKCGTVGKSQSVLMMINPMILFTRTRTDARGPGT
jgi:hypothetical protein